MSKLNKIQSISSEKEYSDIRSLLQRVILLYMLVFLGYQAILSITPFSTIVRALLPFNLKKWLQMLGAALVFADLLVTKGYRRGTDVLLLYGICLCGLISSLMTLKYGYKNNRELLINALIVYSFFYCAPGRADPRLLKRFLHAGYWLLLVLWSTASTLSLCQLALMIGEFSRRRTTVPLLQGKGMYYSRLFGVFYWPEWGAVCALLLLLIGMYYFVTAVRAPERILLAGCNLPCFLYLVLSGSRNAQLCLYFSVFAGFFLYVLSYLSHARQRGVMAALAIALSATALTHGLYLGVIHAASYVPTLFDHYSGSLAEDPLRAEEEDSLASPGQSLRSPAESVPPPALLPLSSPPSGAVLSEEAEAQPVEIGHEKVDDISNGRFDVWRDYLDTWKEYGLFGLSPFNYGPYFQEHHPELYVCTYMKSIRPQAYAKGKIHHPHNGYLLVLVSCGYLGFLLLVIFIIRSCIRVVHHLRTKPLSTEAFFLIMVALAGACSAVFELELFFTYIPTTMLYWTCLGLLNKLLETPAAVRHRRGSAPGAEPRFVGPYPPFGSAYQPRRARSQEE